MFKWRVINYLEWNRDYEEVEHNFGRNWASAAFGNEINVWPNLDQNKIWPNCDNSTMKTKLSEKRSHWKFKQDKANISKTKLSAP